MATSYQDLAQVAKVAVLTDNDSFIVETGNSVRRVPVSTAMLQMGDDALLPNIAFYIDVNVPSSLGAVRVNTGGNEHIRSLWEAEHKDILMDKDGNYTELNPDDCHYTADGEQVADLATHEVLEAWKNCDFMRLCPKTYGRIQEVTVGSSTIQRLWLSLIPLAGGFVIPQQVVGKCKCSIVDGALRSLPGMVTADSKTINAFWTLAQTRSKNHGLANLDFRNLLLYYMMSKYGWRDSQSCKTSDGTLIWGVGLDGSESTGSDKFACQKNIKTGHTFSLGSHDGKVEVADSDGAAVHGVNVFGFENPWGQKWEMVQGLCSVGTDVYCWRDNVMPAGTPTAASFSNIDCVVLTRHNAGLSSGNDSKLMNIVTGNNGQGCYMILKGTQTGINYGDYFSYNEQGQLWLFGGSSDYGSRCGLASAFSYNGWTASAASISARLAYYGDIRRVSTKRLAELIAK